MDPRFPLPRFVRGRPARQFALDALFGARHAINRVDDAVLALAGVRRVLVEAARRSKRSAGLPLRDDEREAQVFARAPHRRARGGTG